MSELTPEQREALETLRADANRAAPHLAELRQTAQDVFSALMSQKQWSIAESPAPQDASPDNGPWNIGAPKLRYFDAAGNEVSSL